ncbi:hydrogen peroxide-inducible genes activator [Reyranella sp. MMS21-HV4-11]|jgi:LysR family hydrogen peroxide-inducible transcriptional activator|uniref:Hydrogen peroxide-inducible genes activator n=2 Tax=Reyranella TaxID=445219 RepID=A0ABS6ILE3_9HYPH|nr:hydrogen peroxide-inducible genes activator [Reyranella sp. MMS21-HV4-11]MBU8874577.1 hydrogen peroxide-inducible genes activator [Reyranella sp. MMS21-HV4-11]
MTTLRQLSYLVALADSRNFRRAADLVHIAQPTLSQQLRALEARLGVTLVERNESPVQLTPIGRDLVTRARKILLDVKDAEDMVRRAKAGIGGTIRFGVTPTLGPYLMPRIVASLHRRFPDMRLYIREGIPDEQARELARGELDMVLSPLPVSGSDLHIEPLFREPLHIVCPPEHPLGRSAKVRRGDLAGIGFLSLDRRHHAHRQAREICEDLKATLLEGYEGTSLDSLRQMCGSGLGFAILPELYLRSEVGGEDMVTRLTMAGWSASRSIAAVWRDGSAYSDSYGTIAETIATEARAILAGPAL